MKEFEGEPWRLAGEQKGTTGSRGGGDDSKGVWVSSPKESDHHANGGLYQQKRGVTETTHLQVGSQKYLTLTVNHTLIANKSLFPFDLSV